MDTSIANFGNYKKMFDTQVVYVGDLVEWEDYDGQVDEGRVVRIEYAHVDTFPFTDSVECLPLWEKDEYVVFLENSFSIIGSAIVRKIVRKTGDRKTQALPRRSNVN